MFVEIKQKGHKDYGKIYEMSDESWHKGSFYRYGEVYVRSTGALAVRGTKFKIWAINDGDVVRYDPYFYKPFKKR
jgi:hypothetical protein